MHTKTQQSYEFTPRKANFFKAFSHMKRAQVFFLQALHRNYHPNPKFYESTVFSNLRYITTQYYTHRGRANR